MVAHKNHRLGLGKYLNLEKHDWKMDGEINPRQGQKGAVKLKVPV
jgi:hypothetical protein